MKKSLMILSAILFASFVQPVAAEELGEGSCCEPEKLCDIHQSGPCVSYCQMTGYKPCYYCEKHCVKVPYCVQKKCTRYVPQYYTKQCCKMVPQYYTKTYCRQVPECYYVNETKYCNKYYTEKKCKYVPYTYVKKTCSPAPECAPACPSECGAYAMPSGEDYAVPFEGNYNDQNGQLDNGQNNRMNRHHHRGLMKNKTQNAVK